MRRLKFTDLGGRRQFHHVAATRVRPGERTTEHTHDFPELFLILEGSGVHAWNGRQYRLARGDLVLILAADSHQYRCGENETLRFVNLALAPRWWGSFETLLGADAPPSDPARRHRKLGARDLAVCTRVLDRLLSGDSDGAGALVAAVGILTDAVLASQETAALVPEADLSAAPEWLARLVYEMEGADSAVQPLGYWQKRSGRSPEHLARSCRRYLGVTLTEMVHRARLNRARAGLRGGEGKIADVALEAGFNNLGHFYRTFRRAEGCSPRKWSRTRGAASTVPR
jgi:AraC family cel operon transcriptional repressor